MYENRTDKEYGKNLDDFIITHPGQVTEYFSISGHMKDSHVGLTDDEMILDVSKYHKDVSQFLSYQPEDGEFDDLSDIIENALLYNSRDIAVWATSEKMDFDREKALAEGRNDPYEYLELDTLFNNVIGYGYQVMTNEKMDTPVLKMVLKRDESDPYFHFKIQTAFPSIKAKEARYLRQFECTRAGIDPYKDGKLTVEPEQLEQCRVEVISKTVAKTQISRESDESLRETERKKQMRSAKLVEKFLYQNHIPKGYAELRIGKNPKTGRNQKEIWVLGQPIGFVRTDYVAEKYRALNEVKTMIAKKSKEGKKEMSKSRKQDLTAKYNGIFLNAVQVGRLAGSYGSPLDKIIENPHITLQYRPTPKQEAAFHRLLGQKVKVTLLEYANDGMNEGFLVGNISSDDPEVQKLIDSTPSGIPHVTISVNEKAGAKPKDTYRLFDGSEDTERKHVNATRFTATIGEYVIVKGKGPVVITDEKDLPDEMRQQETPEVHKHEKNGAKRFEDIIKEAEGTDKESKDSVPERNGRKKATKKECRDSDDLK